MKPNLDSENWGEGSKLSYFFTQVLAASKRFKSSSEYKDNLNHKPVFAFWFFDGGHPIPGLSHEFFGERVPSEVLGEISRDLTRYLKTGNVNSSILEFFTAIYLSTHRNLDAEFSNRVRSELDLDMTKHFRQAQVVGEIQDLARILKSWSIGPAAGRFNLAAAVNRVGRYSAYAGSDFERIYNLIVQSLRKNRVTLKPGSRIVVKKKVEQLSNQILLNSMGFSQVDIQRWNSMITYTIDGHEYLAGEFNSETGYGRY